MIQISPELLFVLKSVCSKEMFWDNFGRQFAFWRYCFFFYQFLIFNLIPNGCENRCFLKQATPTFSLCSANIALFSAYCIFFFIKNKMKVSFWLRQKQFSEENTETVVQNYFFHER